VSEAGDSAGGCARSEAAEADAEEPGAEARGAALPQLDVNTRTAGGAAPGLDWLPSSPINRVDSTVPLVTEASAELSLSSATSLSAAGDDAGGGAVPEGATGAAAAAAEARGHAGCAPPCPALCPGAVEAHNRAAAVAAAACGLHYVGIHVQEAAAIAETAYSCAAAVEAAAAKAAGGGAAPHGRREAAGERRARPGGTGVAAAPAGAAAGGDGEEGGDNSHLLGPASPKSAAGAAMMAERWAADEAARG
jgi:hypothetical protein